MRLAEAKAKGKLWHIIFLRGRWTAISLTTLGPHGFPLGVTRRSIRNLIKTISNW